MTEGMKYRLFFVGVLAVAGLDLYLSSIGR